MSARGARALAGALLLVVVPLAACQHSAVQLSVTPGTALYDAPLATTVDGLEPGQQVTLTVTSTDKTGATWSSSAVFTASGAGRASTADAPVSGSYSGADPMGLVETLTPGKDGQIFGVPDPWTMTFTATVDGSPQASTTVTRQLPAATGVTAKDLRPDPDGIYGSLYLPATTPSTPQPAVVVVGGSEGGLSTGSLAGTLAAHGYPALALAYFHAPGLPDSLANIPLEYFAKAVQLLAGQPGVDRNRIVMTGISRGSEAALLTAAHYPDLVHAVIAGVPASQAHIGLSTTPSAAWTFAGQPVPTATGVDAHVPAPDSPSAIPVEQISGPLLLVCGGQDEIWPSCAYTDAITARLTQKGVTRAPTVLRYADAGHFVGSLLPYDPSTSVSGKTADGTYVLSGGTFQAAQAGTAQAWPRVLAFLHDLP